MGAFVVVRYFFGGGMLVRATRFEPLIHVCRLVLSRELRCLAALKT